MSKQSRNSKLKMGRNEGFALVLVMVMLLALTYAGVSLMSNSAMELKAVASNTLIAQCRHVAEVGALEAAAQIVPDLNDLKQADGFYPEARQDLISGSMTLASKSFGYSVTAQGDSPSGLGSVPDQRINVNSLCRGPENTVFTVRLDGNARAGSVFSCGFCACDDIDISSDFSTDSYDSQLGSYGSSSGSTANIEQFGDVCADGDITTSNGTVIQGSVIAGGDVTGSGTVYGAVTAGGTSTIPGATEGLNPVPDPCNCESFDLDARMSEIQADNDNSKLSSHADCGAMAALGNLNVAAGDLCNMPSGDYYFTDMSILGSVHISGPTKIYLDGSGPFLIAGGGFINSSNDARFLQIFSDTTGEIRYQAGPGSIFSGYIYAPFAAFRADTDLQIFGSVTAYDIIANSDVTLHYDAAAGTQEEHFVDGFSPSTWSARAGQ